MAGLNTKPYTFRNIGYLTGSSGDVEPWIKLEPCQWAQMYLSIFLSEIATRRILLVTVDKWTSVINASYLGGLNLDCLLKLSSSKARAGVVNVVAGVERRT